MVKLTVIQHEKMGFATMLSGSHPLAQLTVTNTGSLPLTNLRAVVRTVPAVMQEEVYPLPDLLPGESARIAPKHLQHPTPYLIGLNAPERGTLAVGIFSGDEVIAAQEKSLALYPTSYWMGNTGNPMANGAYVEPNHPYFSRLLKHGTTYLHRISPKLSFTGYDAGTVQGVKSQVYALWEAFHEEHFTEDGQLLTPGMSIRTYDKIIDEKTGSCLDLSLFFAGLLEHIGLHPILIFTKNHVDVGVWLKPVTFPEGVQDDPRNIACRVGGEEGEICLLDPAMASAGPRLETVEQTVLSRMKDPYHFLFGVDIHQGRVLGIRPLPTKHTDPRGNLVYNKPWERETATPEKMNLPREEIWERKLLDLSLRNSLLNFSTKRRGITVEAANLAELISLCHKGDAGFTSAPEGVLGDGISQTGHTALPVDYLRSELSQGRLVTPLGPDQLKQRLNTLYRGARTSLEESGANPLYLAVGFLKWFENGKSQTPRYAPLILLPAELVKAAGNRGYVLRLREEDPTINITLLEFLRGEFDLTLPLTDSLPRGDWAINLPLVFNGIRRAILPFSGWDVVEGAALSAFSFNRFVLWSDLHTGMDTIKKHKVVSAFIQGSSGGIPPVNFPTPKDFDALNDPTAIACPLPADSSQMAAVAAAGCGASFVLHGPPGTGKSQTIANMIAHALYLGKRVLFVAEKTAALSVVKERLDAIGLSPFALELHSDKAKKSHVLEQLSKTLSQGEKGEHRGFEETAKRLHEEREALGNVLTLLHQEGPGGLSLYDAIVTYETYKDVGDIPALTTENVLATTKETRLALEQLLREAGAAVEGAGGVQNHPLRFWNKHSATAKEKEALALSIDAYLSAAEHFEKTCEKIGNLLPIGWLRGFDQAKTLGDLLNHLSTMTVLPKGLLTAPTLLSDKDKVTNMKVLGEKREALREELLRKFTPDLLLENAREALRDAKAADLAPLLLRNGKKKKERIRLAVFAHDPQALQNEDVKTTWEKVAAYQDLCRELEEAMGRVEHLFGTLAQGENADPQYLYRLWEQSATCKHLSNACVIRGSDLTRLLAAIDTLASDGSLVKEHDLFLTYNASFERLTGAERQVAELCGSPILNFRQMTDWPATQTLQLKRGLAHISGLREYTVYLHMKDRLEKAGLGALSEAMECGKLSPKDLIGAYYFKFSQLAIELALEHPTLREQTGEILSEKIRTLRELDEKFRTLTAREVVSLLKERLPSPQDSGTLAQEITTLGRAIRTGSRGMSLRRLFENIPHLLMKTSPCMLMSPLSCAQYLSDATPPFDLVIFDEASQMPTCEAVRAISRGRSLVVVGDPNQLPPTNFFSTVNNEEEWTEDVAPDSLLDDCLALGMPQTYLLWHYRSRHESLIAYSNQTYYGNKLSTFPSPGSPVSRVGFVKTPGIYDRGHSKQNRGEAECVVSEVVRRLRLPGGDKHSIGIVTFSKPQQILIEDLLEERLSQDSHLLSIQERLPQPIFVKNLENVQGDERDIILFSVCYGADKTGRVSLNFGPLNKEGGWRRLNVAVTRAKEEMVVFSSITPEQIDLSRTTSEGVRGLRYFLEYARGGKEQQWASQNTHPDKAQIGESVAIALRARGWQVDTQVGASHCKVDIAVRHPQHPNTYLLGILTDGDTPGSLLDRFAVREGVLKSLGWNLCRLWSIDFWDHPKKVLDKVENQLKHLEKSFVCEEADPLPGEEPLLSEQDSPAPLTVTANTITGMPASPKVAYRFPITQGIYTATRLTPIPAEKNGPGNFFHPENRETVLFEIREVLVKEAPISHRLLCKRIAEAWAIRVTDRVSSYIAALVKETVCTPREQKGTLFYWGLGQEGNEYSAFRIPKDASSRRDFEDIPREEIASAVAYLANGKGSLSRLDAMRDTLKLFGYNRPSEYMEGMIEEGIALAITRGTLQERDGRILSQSIL